MTQQSVVSLLCIIVRRNSSGWKIHTYSYNRNSRAETVWMINAEHGKCKIAIYLLECLHWKCFRHFSPFVYWRICVQCAEIDFKYLFTALVRLGWASWKASWGNQLRWPMWIPCWTRLLRWWPISIMIRWRGSKISRRIRIDVSAHVWRSSRTETVILLYYTLQMNHLPKRLKNCAWTQRISIPSKS